MASERRRRISEVHFIYDLPYFERKELCRILDVNNKWELLAGKYMHYTTLDIQELRHQERIGNSPTDQLLNCWGSQNHTIMELFILLYQIKHHQAMMILKPFVDPQYHCLLFEGEESITRLLQSKLNTTGTQSAMGAGAAGPSPSAPSPSSLHDKTLGYSQKNINVANQSDAVPGPSYKAGLSEFLQPQIKIQNSNFPVSDERNINESSPDVNRVEGQKSEQMPGPSGIYQPPTSPTRQIPSPTNNPSPVLTIPSPSFPGSQSPKFEGNRSNLSPNRSPSPCPSPTHASNLEGRSPTPQRRSSCGSHYSPCEDDLPHISYKELDIATGGWDKNNILGRGGFGTVFKGTWKSTEVAVKRLELQKGESPESQEVQRQQSLREMRILRSSPHDNILPLYGYSMGGDQPCLVYKFMASGSLEDRLLCRGNTPVLNWIQRLNIATGTARGLQFLHNREKPLIHGDIKSANILLDSALEPRIGDFGLAREGPQSSQYTHVKVSRVHGTRPYLPDEFLRYKKLSTKVDTYSFGVVLYELATGLRAFDDSRSHKYLKDLVERTPDDPEEQIKQLRDKRLQPNSELFLALLATGKICANKNPKERPEMVDVLADLANRMKAFEIRSRAHAAGMQLSSLQPSNPYSYQHFYDEQKKRRSSMGSNFPGSYPCSGSPVLGPATPGFYPTGTNGCPVGNLLGSGYPIPSGHVYPSLHPSIHQVPGLPGLTPAMAININRTLSQDTPGTPPVQNLYPSPPQNILQRRICLNNALRFKLKEGVPANYPEFLKPSIAVMPPTLSKNLPSSAQSYCETEASQYSHATSFAPPPEVEEEDDVNADTSNAGNLPLLSVLGINQNSGAIVEEDSSQLSSTNNNSTGSNKSGPQTSNTNNNVSISNAVTVRSCRSENSNPASNSESAPPESVLPNLEALGISPATP